MQLNPHDHAMFAVVGLYGGQEDNTFFRRGESRARDERAAGRSSPATCSCMGDDAIHAVANPKREYAVALHVYGGDFFDGAPLRVGRRDRRGAAARRRGHDAPLRGGQRRVGGGAAAGPATPR